MGLMDQWQALYGKPNSDRQNFGRPDKLDLSNQTGGTYGGNNAYQSNGFGSKWRDNWERPTWAYDPSRPWTIPQTRPEKSSPGPLGTGVGNALHDIRDNTQYMPYDDYGSAYDRWAKGLDWMNKPENLLSNTTANLDPFGNKSAVGQYYSGAETNAMNNLSRLGSSNATQRLGNDIVGLRERLRSQQSPLERANQDRLMAAATGGISRAGQNVYNTRSALMDQAAEDERQAMLGSLGEGNSLWGSNRLEATRDLAERQTAGKQAVLADIMNTEAGQGIQYDLAGREMENNLLNIASDIGKSGLGTQLSANSQQLGYITNAGNLMANQQEMKMRESLANIDNMFKNIDAWADKSKWENQYDLDVRKNITDNISSLWDAFFGGLGTLGSVFANVTG